MVAKGRASACPTNNTQAHARTTDHHDASNQTQGKIGIRRKVIDFTGYVPPASVSRADDGVMPVASHPQAPIDPAFAQQLISERYPNKMTFTIEEVAAFLSVDYETIRRRVADGRIISICVGRRRIIPIHVITDLYNNGVE